MFSTRHLMLGTSLVNFVLAIGLLLETAHRGFTRGFDAPADPLLLTGFPLVYVWGIAMLTGWNTHRADSFMMRRVPLGLWTVLIVSCLALMASAGYGWLSHNGRFAVPATVHLASMIAAGFAMQSWRKERILMRITGTRLNPFADEESA